MFGLPPLDGHPVPDFVTTRLDVYPSGNFELAAFELPSLTSMELISQLPPLISLPSIESISSLPPLTLLESINPLIPIKSCRIVFIGDPHFRVEATAENLQFASESLKVIKTLTPDLIVVAGDTLDRFENANSEPFTEATQWLGNLEDVAPVVLLIGNHDLRHPNDYLTRIHHFNPFKRWTNTVVVDYPVQLTIHGYKLAFIPYVPDGSLAKAIREPVLSEPIRGLPSLYPRYGLDPIEGFSLVFAHQTIKGAMTYNNKPSLDGDYWPPNYPMLISGHLHLHHQPHPNVLYPGTPKQQKFDEDPDKALTLIELTTGNRVITRHRMAIPIKVMVELAWDQLDTYVIPPDQQLKISIRGTAAQLESVKGHPTIKALKAARHVVRNKPQINPNSPVTTTSLVTPELPAPRRSFFDTLRTLVHDKPDQQRAFERVFKVSANSLELDLEDDDDNEVSLIKSTLSVTLPLPVPSPLPKSSSTTPKPTTIVQPILPVGVSPLRTLAPLGSFSGAVIAGLPLQVGDVPTNKNL